MSLGLWIWMIPGLEWLLVQIPEGKVEKEWHSTLVL